MPRRKLTLNDMRRHIKQEEIITLCNICRFIVVACLIISGACSERKPPSEVIHAPPSEVAKSHSAWDQLDLNLLKRIVMRAPDAHTLEGWLNWPTKYEQIPLHNADFDNDGLAGLSVRGLLWL